MSEKNNTVPRLSFVFYIFMPYYGEREHPHAALRILGKISTSR